MILSPIGCHSLNYFSTQFLSNNRIPSLHEYKILISDLHLFKAMPSDLTQSKYIQIVVSHFFDSLCESWCFSHCYYIPGSDFTYFWSQRNVSMLKIPFFQHSIVRFIEAVTCGDLPSDEVVSLSSDFCDWRKMIIGPKVQLSSFIDGAWEQRCVYIYIYLS